QRALARLQLLLPRRQLVLARAQLGRQPRRVALQLLGLLARRLEPRLFLRAPLVDLAQLAGAGLRQRLRLLARLLQPRALARELLGDLARVALGIGEPLLRARFERRRVGRPLRLVGALLRQLPGLGALRLQPRALGRLLRLQPLRLGALLVQFGARRRRLFVQPPRLGPHPLQPLRLDPRALRRLLGLRLRVAPRLLGRLQLLRRLGRLRQPLRLVGLRAHAPLFRLPRRLGQLRAPLHLLARALELRHALAVELARLRLRVGELLHLRLARLHQIGRLDPQRLEPRLLPLAQLRQLLRLRAGQRQVALFILARVDDLAQLALRRLEPRARVVRVL